MSIKPFLKWAGGKRWLAKRDSFQISQYSGRYFEPFLGGGAIYFAHSPKRAVLSDLNSRLIDAYTAIRENWGKVQCLLNSHQKAHSSEYYYGERSRQASDLFDRAAQFLYLNRACWNGLYRENLKGEFNVPIGTKQKIVFEDDDFAKVSELLKGADIICSDFEAVVDLATDGDFLFIDPPYTTAHNMNGFVKYNEKIFSWEDQVRLSQALRRAAERGAEFLMTNANHQSILDLYHDFESFVTLPRQSVISGSSRGRQITTEVLIKSYEDPS
ncbi:DNA adenine methylase [Mesorhizobium sp. RSR565B]|uniref:DNA adenine methylase n=1 Tax=Mesorhizobium sp. L103C565B0 TaxID=1287094 RepID=UPI0005185879|nr:Dam family site-specific DNA-(adenine-N6)-methyltransferase [Mesorhizobium sp. L103C565B0]